MRSELSVRAQALLPDNRFGLVAVGPAAQLRCLAAAEPEPHSVHDFRIEAHACSVFDYADAQPISDRDFTRPRMCLLDMRSMLHGVSCMAGKRVRMLRMRRVQQNEDGKCAFFCVSPADVVRVFR